MNYATATATPTITRTWAMPSADTFSIRPIADLLDRWLAGRRVVIDPFARNSRRGTITNDLNPATAAQDHLPAERFADNMVARRIEADAVLFDPPYSPRQITECYQSAGLVAGRAETQSARMGAHVKHALGSLVLEGGIAICFGWNSMGFGKGRGFEMVEILLVNHGGAHNDTIVTVERKLAAAPSLFDTEESEVSP